MFFRCFLRRACWPAVSIGVVLLAFFAVRADAGAAQSAKGVFDVRDYGAVGDGVTLDTKAIQAAIDACTQAGGGKVYLHNGRFLSGTIYLKSNVTLYLEAGAVLLGSTNIEDFPITVPALRSYTDNYTNKSLIYAERQENISIMGRGTIDGQGTSYKGPGCGKATPYMIRIIECKNVMTKDVTLRNSPMWMQHYMACDNVTIDGIFVRNWSYHCNDCIDIDGCHNVRISNCDLSSDDDALCLKSTSNGNRACKNVTITNCVISSSSNAIKMGTESSGGFQNITIDNCAIYDTRKAGIALELVDGGTFDRVNVSNITMDNVKCVILIRLGNRARTYKPGMKKPGVGSMKNIIISNIQASLKTHPKGVWAWRCWGTHYYTGDGLPSHIGSITGLPGFPVENVTLENIRVKFGGGGTLEDALREIPEVAEKYPEYTMFGTLPAYGFYVRHAKNVNFHHIELEFEEDDHRPAMVFDDVSDLEIFDIDAESSPKAKAMMWLKQVDGAFIHGCRPSRTIAKLIRLDGDKSDNVTLMNNDLSNVEQILEKGKEMKAGAVYLGNNRTR